MDPLPFAATTPTSVGRVGLRARDAEALAQYYRKVVGLNELRRTTDEIVLGAGGRELLSIENDPSLKPDDPRSAGLFHTAFLLPARSHLARWTRHAIADGIRIDGASDHLVSEAIYLTDPEGNGIEIYADRRPQDWAREDGAIKMATIRLDFDNLMANVAQEPEWTGAPDNTVIGHVHLRVGNIGAAEAWWHENAGLDTMVHYGDAAVFLSSGGYHHHIGSNIWQSRNAGPREKDRAGLAYVELLSRDATETKVLADPWGSEIRIVPKAA